MSLLKEIRSRLACNVEGEMMNDREHIHNDQTNRPFSHRCGRMKSLIAGLLLFIGLSTFWSFAPLQAHAAKRVVRVGLYENAPKVFTSPEGRPAGIFVDVLAEIAKKENWSLQYVPCQWAECLEGLKSGQIDLMPDVARTAERERLYSFHEIPVLASCFQVYARKGSGIRSILDLNGKRIAVLDGSVQQSSFQALAKSFGLSITLAPASDYRSVFELVMQNDADAAISNQFFGAMNARKSGLEDTAIIFNPSDLFFAAPKEGSEALLNALDKHLKVMKEDTQSEYYRTIRRWTSEEVSFKVPTWLLTILLIVVTILVITLVEAWYWKVQLNKRTQELLIRNKEFERVTDAFVAMDNNWKLTQINARAGEILNRQPESLVGKNIWVELPTAISESLQQTIQRAMNQQKSLTFEDYHAPTERWFEYSIYPSPEGISIYFHDITRRKNAEFGIRVMNRALRTLSECNQALVHAQDEPTLLNEICRILVEHGGYRTAWVGYALTDENKTIQPIAQIGAEPGYIESLNLSWADNESGSGPTGMAIRTGRPVAAQDISTHPSYALWREAARKHDYASLAALPLKQDHQVLGALVVCSSATDAFHSDEMKLLEELAGDLAFGIVTIRSQEERIKAETEKQATYRLLESIIEFLPDATFVIDQGKRIIAWNNACETMTGIKKEAMLGRGDYAYAEPFIGKRRPILVDLLDEAPSPAKEKGYKYVRREGDAIFGEAFVPTWRDGEGGHLWSAARMLFDQEGNRRGAIESIRDVTEERRIQDALRASEQEYRELVMLANSIILRWDREGRITFLNEFGQRFFGYTLGEIVNRHVVGSIVPPNESTGRDLRPLIAEVTANPQKYERNINENIRRNGERVWIDWTNKTVFDEHGEVKEILSVGLDITERKKAEDQVRRLNEDLERHAEVLEQRVEERTAELVVAKDRAESADRVKSAFLASMSHELRTPLNSIIGFTGILLQELAGPLNPEQKKQLVMVQDSSRHLLNLINDVLDISKIEAGQLTLSASTFELKPSIEKMIALVTPMAQKKGLELSLDLADDINMVTTDQRRLEQVILNLLNNAVKFTEHGSVRVTCRSENGSFLLAVTDTGIGMPADELKNLFQPFHQIDTGLARKHEGTGLGLSICKRLLNMMGGKIWVESQVDVGSTFYVNFTNVPEKSHE